MERIEYAFNTEMFMENIRSCFKTGRDTSLRDIEDKTGISASTFSRIQNGTAPDMDTFMTICGKLDLLPERYFIRQVWELKKT